MRLLNEWPDRALVVLNMRRKRALTADSSLGAIGWLACWLALWLAGWSVFWLIYR